MSFTNVVNMMPGMVESEPLVTYDYALTVGFAGSETLPPGKYHLLRMTVTTLPTRLSAGCAELAIVPFSCYSPPGVVTSFGSSCAGARGDGVLRLGEDWVDNGYILGCTDNIGRAPAILCPAESSVGKGSPFPSALLSRIPTAQRNFPSARIRSRREQRSLRSPVSWRVRPLRRSRGRPPADKLVRIR